jgi:hypothetical protein
MTHVYGFVPGQWRHWLSLYLAAPAGGAATNLLLSTFLTLSDTSKHFHAVMYDVDRITAALMVYSSSHVVYGEPSNFPLGHSIPGPRSCAATAVSTGSAA